MRIQPAAVSLSPFALLLFGANVHAQARAFPKAPIQPAPAPIVTGPARVFNPSPAQSATPAQDSKSTGTFANSQPFDAKAPNVINSFGAAGVITSPQLPLYGNPYYSPFVPNYGGQTVLPGGQYVDAYSQALANAYLAQQAQNLANGYLAQQGQIQALQAQSAYFANQLNPFAQPYNPYAINGQQGFGSTVVNTPPINPPGLFGQVPPWNPTPNNGSR